MKILLKIAALSVLVSLMGLFPTLALADDPAVTCDTGETFETIVGDNVIATEITEPLGSLDQKITSNLVDVSVVYWKYNCEKDDEKTSRYVKYGNSFTCPDGATCTIVQIIKGTSGTGILKTYISVIYRWAAGIVGIIATLVIVISGIQISMDQGSGEAVGAAKTRIMQSLGGLVVLFLSALILYTINPTFFQQ